MNIDEIVKHGSSASEISVKRSPAGSAEVEAARSGHRSTPAERTAHMARPNVTDLQNSARFRLLTELGHQEIMAFVHEYYWGRKTWVTVTHYVFSLAVVGAWIEVGLAMRLPGRVWVTQFGFGFLAFLVILPLHEAIHAAVYRAFGARDVRVLWSLQKGYAYAIASDFVVDRREFTWVAVMPFLLINTALVLGALLLEPFRFFLMAVLAAHTSGTSGDWAMLNYLWLHRKQEVYTFDNAEEHKSSFYCRITPENE